MLVPDISEYAKRHIDLSLLAAAASGALATYYRDRMSVFLRSAEDITIRFCIRLGWYPILERRYKHSLLASSLRRIRVGYREYEFDVNKQYIKLMLMHGFVPPVDQGPFEPSRTTSSITDVLKAVGDQSIKLVVLGHPGSGKTTLLRHLTLLYAHDGPKPTSKDLLPVLLFLRDAKSSHLLDSICATFETHKFPNPRGYLQAALKKGTLLLLFDGLDELIGEDRRRITKEVRELATRYDNNIFIVTSRIDGYKRDQDASFKEVEVAPIDPESPEAAALVSGILMDHSEQEHFLHALRSDESLRHLAQSPLLLSLILFIYKESEGNLPRKRHKIYKHFIQWMLKDRDETKEIYEYRNKFDPDDKDLVLRKLAYLLFCQRAKECTRSVIISTIAGLVEQFHVRPTTESAFLDEITQNNYLLQNIYADHYSYIHLTFQEYYAAREIHEAGRINEVHEHISDPSWVEVILFLCGLQDADATERLIEFVLEHTRDYVLAGRCLAHASSPLPGLSKRIVPGLVRQLSYNARQVLIELSDTYVAEHLCELFRSTRAIPEEQLFVKECLRALSSDLVTQAVIQRTERWLNENEVGKALEELNAFGEFVNETVLQEETKKLNQRAEDKLKQTIAGYRDHLSSCRFADAMLILSDYEKAEGLRIEFLEMRQLVADIEASWNTIIDTISEGKSLKVGGELRNIWHDLRSQCVRASIDPSKLQLRFSQLLSDRAGQLIKRDNLGMAFEFLEPFLEFASNDVKEMSKSINFRLNEKHRGVLEKCRHALFLGDSSDAEAALRPYFKTEGVTTEIGTLLYLIPQFRKCLDSLTATITSEGEEDEQKTLGTIRQLWHELLALCDGASINSDGLHQHLFQLCESRIRREMVYGKRMLWITRQRAFGGAQFNVGQSHFIDKERFRAS